MEIKTMNFQSKDVDVKDYGYMIKKIDDGSQLTITNESIKEEFKQAFPWAKGSSQRFKEKKFIRDPNPEGIYWNYKNAKQALKHHYRILHIFSSRREGMNRYAEEFKKYEIVKISDHKIGLHKKLNICFSISDKTISDDFEGDTIAVATIDKENL